MKPFFERLRKKTPKPPRQSTSPGKFADIAAEPLSLREELDVIPSDEGQKISDEDPEADHIDLTVPPNEGRRTGPWAPCQDGMDRDQELPASGASTSVVAIGGTDYGNLLASKCS